MYDFITAERPGWGVGGGEQNSTHYRLIKEFNQRVHSLSWSGSYPGKAGVGIHRGWDVGEKILVIHHGDDWTDVTLGQMLSFKSLILRIYTNYFHNL